MLELGCVWEGVEYGPEAVLILHDMILRNLPEGTQGRFICFSDRPEPLGDIVERRSLASSRSGIVMFPLGCIIVRGLDNLLHGRKLDTVFYDGSFPERASIVVFPPGERPQDATNWVSEVYKMGGGTTPQIDLVTNLEPRELYANVRAAHARAYSKHVSPASGHGGTAIVCAGGPSLANSLMDIQIRQARGGKIFAVSNVARFLLTKGITADAHVLLDGLLSVVEHTWFSAPMIRYYSAQCHSSVLDAARDELVIWTPYSELVNEAIPDFTGPLIGGGTTVGTRAICLAFMLGYRDFHLYGFDSSQDMKGAIHAYDQTGEYLRFLDVRFDGKDYKVPPQFLQQIEDFKLLLPELLENECSVTVHGRGLLPDVAARMAG